VKPGYVVKNWMLNSYMPHHGTTLQHKPAPVLKKFTSWSKNNEPKYQTRTRQYVC